MTFETLGAIAELFQGRHEARECMGSLRRSLLLLRARPEPIEHTVFLHRALDRLELERCTALDRGGAQVRPVRLVGFALR